MISFATTDYASAINSHENQCSMHNSKEHICSICLLHCSTPFHCCLKSVTIVVLLELQWFCSLKG